MQKQSLLLQKSYEDCKKRIKKLLELTKNHNFDALIISTPLHIFYFTNTFARGCLLITKEKALLLVNKPFSRAKEETFLPVEELKSLKNLLEILNNHKLNNLGVEGELKEFLNNHFKVTSIDNYLFECRKIKTEFEIECIKKAGLMLHKAINRAIKRIKPGITELSASAEIEKELRILGHPGVTRAMNFELNMGHLISGKAGTMPIHIPTGQGGKGVIGFPGGASEEKIRKKAPILIDFSGYYRGYYIDQTRMLKFKEICEDKKTKQWDEVFQWALKIMHILAEKIVPGIKSKEAYEIAWETANKSPYKEFFMKHGDSPLKFVGHGVGMQIDEPPIISAKNEEVLKENMVIALEPKFHISDIGVIGIEDTFVITQNGLKRLTKTPQKWLEI